MWPPTREQFQRWYTRLGPMVAHLHQARERLHRRGYRPDDDLMRALNDAHNAMHHLMVKVFYRSCNGGVGGSDREADAHVDTPDPARSGRPEGPP